jgi:uncharacterized protein (DUF427 family)
MVLHGAGAEMRGRRGRRTMVLVQHSMPRAEPESVWDYPRPPLIVPTDERVVVELGGVVIAETRRALRVLETSHPPVYYIPRIDVVTGALAPSDRVSWCEFKGRAAYVHARAELRSVADAGWEYPDPMPGYERLRGHVAFYPGRVDRCTVDGELVSPQDGALYGGWITARVQGPFKGAPGTSGW